LNRSFNNSNYSWYQAPRPCPISSLFQSRHHYKQNKDGAPSGGRCGNGNGSTKWRLVTTSQRKKGARVHRGRGRSRANNGNFSHQQNLNRAQAIWHWQRVLKEKTLLAARLFLFANTPSKTHPQIQPPLTHDSRKTAASATATPGTATRSLSNFPSALASVLICTQWRGTTAFFQGYDGVGGSKHRNPENPKLTTISMGGRGRGRSDLWPYKTDGDQGWQPDEMQIEVLAESQQFSPQFISGN